MKKGLTSISFRQKSISEIVDAAKSAKLDTVEWGSDVHCPPDDKAALLEAATKTATAGIEICSYGSYFRLGITAVSEFEKYCQAAKILDTGIIRIWAYDKNPADTTDAEYEKCILQARQISDIARQYGITVCFEYHRGTLTLNCDSAIKLMRNIDRDNMRLYWQPNPEITFEDNCNALKKVLPYVVNIHCFKWIETHTRLPLSDGRNEWQQYISIAKSANVENILLEFVMNDTDEQLFSDAEVLCGLL